MNIDRRMFTLGAAAAMLPMSARAANDPIRVGLLMVKTGALAAGGKHMENGLNFFLNSRNFELAGRKVELITADCAASPAIAKAKTEELVERFHVDVLIGPYTSAEALAVAGSAESAKIPLILSSAGADDLTQRKRNPWMVRTVATSSQLGYTLGDYCNRELKYKRVVTIGNDSNYGYEVVGGFQKLLEATGGKVVQKIWTPFGASDLAPYISQIDTESDCILNCLSGNDSINFYKLITEYGLREKRGVISPPSSVDEPLLTQMGDEVLGAISCGWYSPTAATPGNEAFAAKFREQYKADPGTLSTGAILAGMLLEQAVINLKGDVSDKAAFARALHEAAIPGGAFAPVKLDEFGNAILNMYIRRVVRKNGRLVNEAFAEIPEVGQFWKFDPKAALAAPSFGRS